MKVYVINLKECVNRKTLVTEALNKHQIDYEFHSTERLSIGEINKIYPAKSSLKTMRYKGYKLTDSEVGCFNSHIQLWKKCLEANNPIVILEDNIKITSDNFKQIISLIESKIDKFGIIKLSNTFDRKALSKAAFTNEHNIVSYSKGGCGTLGYVITPRVAKIFLDNSKNFFEPVDDFMETEWRNNCVVYGIEPHIIGRAQISSTIGARKVKQRNFRYKVIKEIYRLYKQTRQFIFNLRKLSH